MAAASVNVRAYSFSLADVSECPTVWMESRSDNAASPRAIPDATASMTRRSVIDKVARSGAADVTVDPSPRVINFVAGWLPWKEFIPWNLGSTGTYKASGKPGHATPTKQGKNYLDICPEIRLRGSLPFAEPEANSLHEGPRAQLLFGNRQRVADRLGRPSKVSRDLRATESGCTKRQDPMLKRREFTNAYPSPKAVIHVDVPFEQPGAHSLNKLEKYTQIPAGWPSDTKTKTGASIKGARLTTGSRLLPAVPASALCGAEHKSEGPQDEPDHQDGPEDVRGA
jgi:hypothetical protein